MTPGRRRAVAPAAAWPAWPPRSAASAGPGAGEGRPGATSARPGAPGIPWVRETRGMPHPAGRAPGAPGTPHPAGRAPEMLGMPHPAGQVPEVPAMPHPRAWAPGVSAMPHPTAWAPGVPQPEARRMPGTSQPEAAAVRPVSPCRQPSPRCPLPAELHLSNYARPPPVQTVRCHPRATGCRLAGGGPPDGRAPSGLTGGHQRAVINGPAPSQGRGLSRVAIRRRMTQRTGAAGSVNCPAPDRAAGRGCARR